MFFCRYSWWTFVGTYEEVHKWTRLCKSISEMFLVQTLSSINGEFVTKRNELCSSKISFVEFVEKWIYVKQSSMDSNRSKYFLFIYSQFFSKSSEWNHQSLDIINLSHFLSSRFSLIRSDFVCTFFWKSQIKLNFDSHLIIEQIKFDEWNSTNSPYWKKRWHWINISFDDFIVSTWEQQVSCSPFF